MARPLRLRDHSYAVVRFACHDCPRAGQYRLAVLAERFGAKMTLIDVVKAVSSDCRRSQERRPGRRCRAYLPGLVDPRPPNLPPADGRRLRLIAGGKHSA
jgi:hypothetical protein